MIVRDGKDLDVWPHTCVATGRGEGEFIDTGLEFTQNPAYDNAHIYLFKGYVEQLAVEHCGMVRASEVERLQAEMDEYGKEVDALHKQMDAVHTIEKLKPKKEVAA